VLILSLAVASALAAHSQTQSPSRQSVVFQVRRNTLRPSRIFFANFAVKGFAFRRRQYGKLLTAKFAKNSREGRKEKIILQFKLHYCRVFDSLQDVTVWR